MIDPDPDELPVHDFDEARMLLRRPFTPAAVKFKTQRAEGGATLCVAYFDARLVIERLNLIVGGGWSPEFESPGGGLMWCHLTVCGVTRRDVGQGQGKALVSDALKRAAVHFGVGVSLYAVPSARVQGSVKTLLPAHLQALRERYEAWLVRDGIRAFGTPFDHGDSEDAQGDLEEASEDEEGMEFAEPPLDDDEARGLVARAEELQTELQLVSRTLVLPAQFQAWLLKSQHSHDALRRFVKFLEEKLAEAREPAA